MRTTKITVNEGALIINFACIYKKHKDVCIVIVNMNSKRGEVCFTGNEGDYPDLFVGATKESLYLNPKCKRDKLTQIIFKDFKGWKILISNLSKYSIYVCLVKEDK